MACILEASATLIRVFFGNSIRVLQRRVQSGLVFDQFGSGPTDSHSASVYEREPDGERLGQFKREAGWTKAASISLVWCITCRLPDFPWVIVR